MPSQAWWGHTRGVVATPGYSIFLTPWAGVKTATGFDTRGQSSGYLGGGVWYDATPGTDSLFTNDYWLDAGTFKVALIFDTGLAQGIYNITGINGTQTIDSYAAAANNVYAEVTGIAVTAGLKTVQVQMATKNAASSNYYGVLNTAAIIRTGA